MRPTGSYALRRTAALRACAASLRSCKTKTAKRKKEVSRIAIYSMNIKVTSRGKGKSAVAAAAYRAGEIIKNQYDGETHDYSDRKDIMFTKILLPDNAPHEYYDREKLWNAVEKIEKAKNAQLARQIRLALPRELSLKQNITLVTEYAKNNFVNQGMIADVCIHDKNDGNPHAHIMLTMRPLEHDGTWAAKSKMEYILNDSGNRIKLPSGRYKTRKINATDWSEQSRAEEWREEWANILNQHLENAGHEIRVDHRSYERQGIEQIPTIHLGVAANDMEKRGIHTERGDINRRIKKANAELKNIDKQIYEIQNPPMPKLFIDLEKSIKAQEGPGYAQWAKIFNLKQAAQTLIYLQENGLTDLNVLHSTAQNARVEQASVQNQINANRAKIKSLTTLRNQANNYRETAEIYNKYNAPGQFKHFKDDYYNRHKADIEKHIKARAYIFDELKLDKFPSLKKLSGDISELYENNKALQRDLKSAQQKAKELNNIEQNTCMLLGYIGLESQGYTPTVPADDLRFTKPYKSSYMKAKKNGESEVYFQNCTIDYDCAEDIYRASSSSANHKSAAKDILTKYGKERAERVIAAIINNAPAEPSARNTEIFQQHRNYIFLDLFIQTLRRVADSMINTIFMRTDKDGNKISKSGWVLPREFAALKSKEKDWDKGLSAKDRLAVAEQMSNNYNSSRKTPQNRSSGRDL